MQSVDDPARREVNPNPKWEVPIELIEWQCSYTQKGAVGLSGGYWSEDWQFADSTKCMHLLKRLYDIGAAVRTPKVDQYVQVAFQERLISCLVKILGAGKTYMSSILMSIPLPRLFNSRF